MGRMAAKKGWMTGRLALMMVSSGSMTVHMRPLGNVQVGSVKLIACKDLMRIMEMIVMLSSCQW